MHDEHPIDSFTGVDRAFFARDVLEVAPDLLGARLSHRTSDGVVTIEITEVEAYAGERDPGAHSYRGRTARNATMFGDAGHVYCYFTYGLHHAINLVTNDTDEPYGCLIRAGRIVDGVELARSRRVPPGPADRAPRVRRAPLADRAIARGPGNVAQALGASLANDGDDLFGGAWAFSVRRADAASARSQISMGPRVGVSGPGGDAVEYPWRFWVSGDPTVSAYRPGRSSA